jgi:hypothetical protein
MAELYLSDGSEFSKIPLLTETVTTDTNLDNHTKTGYYVVRGVPSTGGNASSPVNQWASVFTDADIGTPFQIAIPDGAVSYLYKRALGSSTWKKMSAGYADSAGRANTANSANTANVANTATKSSSTDCVDVADTRNENPAPKDAGFDKKKLTVDFKTASKINSPTGCNGTFCGVLSLAPWSETSGGHGYQLAFGYASEGHPRLALRGSDLSASSWNSWYKVYTSDDKPTLSELGAAAASHTHTKSQISDFPSKLEPYFANNTWYVVGDDAAIGDHNKAGAFCVKGLNGTPNVSLYNSDDSYYGQCITTADIGSQSVKYATTAGSANTEYSVQVSSTQPIDSRCKIWIKI